MLTDANKFLESLFNYDRDIIDPKVMEVIRAKYSPNPEFDPDVIRKASKAAHGLCCWVRAMDVYDRVAKVVAPKKVALQEAQAELATVMGVLNEKKQLLAEVEARIAALEE